MYFVMVNASALRRFEKLYAKLNQLRADADKEAYYYRKDEEVNNAFNGIADIINDAVTQSRGVLREVQSLHGMMCPCMAHKKPAKKTTATKKAHKRA